MEPQNKDKVIIDRAKPEDALAVTNVLHQTWLATYPNEKLGITKEDIEDSYKDSFSEENLERQKERIINIPSNELRLVARHEGEVIGMMTVVREVDHNRLRSAYILPAWQGQGIGQKLWSEARDFCDLTKDTLVRVADYSLGTIEFYKKLGFVDTGRRFTDERWRMKSGSIIPEMEMVIKAKKRRWFGL